MSLVDIILGIVILFGAFRGYREGFLMETISFLAVMLGILGGFKLMGKAMVWLAGQMDINERVLPYVAFAVVFIIIVIAVSWLGKAIKASIDKSFLGRVDQAAGAMIGLLKFAFLSSVFIWIVNSFFKSTVDDWSHDSLLLPIIQDFAPLIISWIGEIIPAVRGIL